MATLPDRVPLGFVVFVFIGTNTLNLALCRVPRIPPKSTSWTTICSVSRWKWMVYGSLREGFGMPTIYKICERAEWEKALVLGEFSGSAVDREDGYIHFSTAHQLRETARRHFAGRHGLVLLSVAAEALGP